MKIAIFGYQGQVGTSLTSALAKTSHELLTFDRSEVDFGNTSQVEDAILDGGPDLVINCCAYTAVDKAEEEASVADAVNHLGVAAMAKAAAEINCPVMHISTDYVYSGDEREPLTESATTHPLGRYGRTKLAGDVALAEQNRQHIILRTSWVFGEHGNNFVKTMLRLAASRDELSVVADQQGCPTYAGDIVNALLAFVEAYRSQKQLPWGVFHCASRGETTWHGFAEAIFAQAVELGLLDKAPKVNAIPTSEFPTPAPRPAYSVLNTDKLEAFLGAPIDHWQSGLTRVLTHIKNTK